MKETEETENELWFCSAVWWGEAQSKPRVLSELIVASTQEGARKTMGQKAVDSWNTDPAWNLPGSQGEVSAILVDRDELKGILADLNYKTVLEADLLE